MAIQIRGVQIQDASIAPGKLDLSADYSFTGAVSVQTPTANDHAATKAYVDAQVPDSFVGGDGIAITDGLTEDTIAVDLATNSGMQFTSNQLDLKIAENSLIKDGAGVKVKLKAESGGTISVDTAGIYIANGAIGNDKLAGSIANAKLANSTISGVALGGNLFGLSSGDGISMSSYDGSAAVSDLTIQLDGGTLAKGTAGLKVASLGISTAQLQDNAVSTAKIGSAQVTEGKLANLSVSTGKIQDGAVSAGKLEFESSVDFFQPDGSTSAFNLAAEVPSDMFAMVMAHKNGLLMKAVQSNPSGADEYTVSTTAGVTTVTFGANLSSSDTLDVRSFGLRQP